MAELERFITSTGTVTGVVMVDRPGTLELCHNQLMVNDRLLPPFACFAVLTATTTYGIRMTFTTMSTLLSAALLAACASSPKNARGEPLTYRVQVVNSCGRNMRFYVDREAFWRGTTMDASPILQDRQTAVRFLKPGKHTLTLIPAAGGSSGRRVKVVLQGPTTIRGC